MNELNALATISLKQSIDPFYGTLCLGSSTKRFNEIWGSNVYQATCLADVAQAPTTTSDLVVQTRSSALRSVFVKSYDTTLRIVMQAINGRVDIPRAGDISLLDGRRLGIGKVTSLPTPSIAYRGQMIYLDADYTESLEDELYFCTFNADFLTYQWRKVQFVP